MHRWLICPTKLPVAAQAIPAFFGESLSLYQELLKYLIEVRYRRRFGEVYLRLQIEGS